MKSPEDGLPRFLPNKDPWINVDISRQMVNCIVPLLLLDYPFEILGLVALNNSYLRFIALVYFCYYSFFGDITADNRISRFLLSLKKVFLIKGKLVKQSDSKWKSLFQYYLYTSMN